ncbi:MAG: alpha/beta fold hydrolase [Ignavibacteriales bacterium]|nr:MAG: alpha/beta fold hydrolase [Ignavibacteriaceae bacterium]MBW7874224.1 alpha/beta fold hydrolase [Ignavibacteria bacterium]MCZ2142304.1 alpha/beta fold hydrolase [Ignavibacteriales bacterium]OQY79572.1 MAG: hypothetical protein B6D45_00575 [Ignavibacteriales bacterium UTCHB3]MBV6445188.1 2-succinyl-6-hydroxy-2,4-cyclohexadiene-1-carboxylate synthase [Ignavibacteriaceae bacterium]
MAKLIFNGVGINYLYHNEGSRHTLLFIHGFGGSSRDWESLISYLPPEQSYLTMDLPGCGESEKGDDLNLYSFSAIADIIKTIVKANKIGSVVPCGYSAGGRIVFYLSANEILKTQKGFVAISSTPGIADDLERKKRKKADRALAKEIREKGTAEWLEKWLSLDMFNGLKNLPEEFMSDYREQRLKNDPEVLSNYLLMSGTGVMAPLHSKLSRTGIMTPLYLKISGTGEVVLNHSKFYGGNRFNQKGLLITGKNDLKYCKIAERLSRMNKDFQHFVVKESWHTVYIEKPKETVALILKFLTDLN